MYGSNRRLPQHWSYSSCSESRETALSLLRFKALVTLSLSLSLCHTCTLSLSAKHNTTAGSLDVNIYPPKPKAIQTPSHSLSLLSSRVVVVTALEKVFLCCCCCCCSMVMANALMVVLVLVVMLTRKACPVRIRPLGRPRRVGRLLLSTSTSSSSSLPLPLVRARA